jgi:hypothetical protein
MSFTVVDSVIYSSALAPLMFRDTVNTPDDAADDAEITKRPSSGYVELTKA